MRIISLRNLAPFLIVPLLVGCGGSTDSRTAEDPTDAPPPRTRPASLDDVVTLRPVGRFDAPVAAAPLPDDAAVLVAEQGGRLLLVEDMVCTSDGTCPDVPVTDGRVVLDLSDEVSTGNEQGLLGVALHPDWPTDPRAFINFTARNGATRIEQVTLGDGAERATDRTLLVEYEQPYANHNGGHLAFGPDGLLYVASGDGGSGGDPNDNAQDPQSVLGKLLRLDVDAPRRVERWAIGLRNPWRFSFDSETGDLWIADVGQSAREEINVLPRRRLEEAPRPNFGWRLREGFTAFDEQGRTGPGALIDPVLDYGRDAGCSITGGVVYRGSAIPELVGRYLFADFCATELRLLDTEGVVGATHAEGDLEWEAIPGIEQIASFTELRSGEVLVLSRAGEVHQLVAP